ncbi:hypothetical protein ANCCAN_06942 [Ancylostoma caninum]|uniref:Uncharacterized protein n=1 Tax=Ancylostoma caninum TaxID=29170 RepID=A0A368GRL5_ANCCA|nr:hypothetical protein ANCCAN_06942 [Ancylostoma caninum]
MGIQEDEMAMHYSSDEDDGNQVRSIVNVVTHVKQRLDDVERTDKAREGGPTPRGDNQEGIDWSVLRAKLEAMCCDVIGGNKKGSRSAVQL